MFLRAVGGWRTSTPGHWDWRRQQGTETPAPTPPAAPTQLSRPGGYRASRLPFSGDQIGRASDAGATSTGQKRLANAGMLAVSSGSPCAFLGAPLAASAGGAAVGQGRAPRPSAAFLGAGAGWRASEAGAVWSRRRRAGSAKAKPMDARGRREQGVVRDVGGGLDLVGDRPLTPIQCPKTLYADELLDFVGLTSNSRFWPLSEVVDNSVVTSRSQKPIVPSQCTGREFDPPPLH